MFKYGVITDEISQDIYEACQLAHRYNLDGVEISIDSWPLIPTYIELESNSEEKINSLLDKLSYNKKDLTTLDVTSIYNDIYNIDILGIKELKFDKFKSNNWFTIFYVKF